MPTGADVGAFVPTKAVLGTLVPIPAGADVGALVEYRLEQWWCLR